MEICSNILFQKLKKKEREPLQCSWHKVEGKNNRIRGLEEEVGRIWWSEDFSGLYGSSLNQPKKAAGVVVVDVDHM